MISLLGFMNLHGIALRKIHNGRSVRDNSWTLQESGRGILLDVIRVSLIQWHLLCLSVSSRPLNLLLGSCQDLGKWTTTWRGESDKGSWRSSRPCFVCCIGVREFPERDNIPGWHRSWSIIAASKHCSPERIKLERQAYGRNVFRGALPLPYEAMGREENPPYSPAVKQDAKNCSSCLTILGFHQKNQLT
jgi:hypothetical protein